MRYVRRTLELLSRRGIRCALVVTPMPRETISDILNYGEISRSLEKIAHEEGADFIDFNLGERAPLDRSAHFYDFHHMRQAGSRSSFRSCGTSSSRGVWCRRPLTERCSQSPCAERERQENPQLVMTACGTDLSRGRDWASDFIRNAVAGSMRLAVLVQKEAVTAVMRSAVTETTHSTLQSLSAPPTSSP